MILAGVTSGKESFDALAFVEKRAALSKFLLKVLEKGSLLCASGKRRERCVHDVDL